MARLLCQLGLHDWRTAFAETLMGRLVPCSRACRRCGRLELE